MTLFKIVKQTEFCKQVAKEIYDQGLQDYFDQEASKMQIVQNGKLYVVKIPTRLVHNNMSLEFGTRYNLEDLSQGIDTEFGQVNYHLEGNQTYIDYLVLNDFSDINSPKFGINLQNGKLSLKTDVMSDETSTCFDNLYFEIKENNPVPLVIEKMVTLFDEARRWEVEQY